MANRYQDFFKFDVEGYFKDKTLMVANVGAKPTKTGAIVVNAVVLVDNTAYDNAGNEEATTDLGSSITFFTTQAVADKLKQGDQVTVSKASNAFRNKQYELTVNDAEFKAVK